MRHTSLSRLLVLLILLWSVGFSFGPVLEDALTGTQGTMKLYERICHQDPARSFSWFGHHWAVCHRCSAIYIGFMVSALIVLVRGRLTLDAVPRPGVILLLIAPVIVDAMADLTGIWSSDMSSRLVTGNLAGVSLALVVCPALFDALHKLDRIAEPSPSAGAHDA